MDRSLEIAWAAGLFEGEGTLVLRNRGYSQAQITSTDEDVVERFYSVVRVGKLYGPYERVGRESNKPYWQWTACHRDDLILIHAMFKPFLGKRRAAKFEELVNELVLVKSTKKRVA